jgi:hypothetical protein
MVNFYVFGSSTSVFKRALLRDLSPRTHQGGDDVVFDFSVRVWHVATSDGVGDASRWWTSPQERIVRKHCHSKAEFERRMSCTTGNAWCSILRTVCPSTDSSAASADASCLAGGTAETEHGGS